MNIVPLHLLRDGQSGPITDIDGKESTLTHLGEIGLNIGETLRVVRAGCPCIVAVGDQRLSIRSEESTTIFVEVR